MAYSSTYYFFFLFLPPPQLPSEKLDLRRICESLLKVEPRNPYALEALIRLKIEAFFCKLFIFPQVNFHHAHFVIFGLLIR